MAIQLNYKIVCDKNYLDTPAKAASLALKGLQQQLQQQHNEIQRQRQSQEPASPVVGYNGNRQMVIFRYVTN